jgi:4-hydroxyproline epimerase
MCGHGTIGLMATLAHTGQIQPGTHKIETPVGDIMATLHENGEVTLENVPSHRSAHAITIEVPGLGPITGDVAYGGNWFFLTESPNIALNLANIEALTNATWLIRQALNAQGITGDNHAEIDHIELFAPAQSGGNSRNFVLCPGKAYDRSPCGTGTSAKIACLAADQKLAPGQIWRQESIVGSHFDASYRLANGQILPIIRGQAFVNAQATLLLNPADPFNHGIHQDIPQ